MAIFNKRKSIKKLNKTKLSKKSKKNRFKNKQIGGNNDNDTVKYKYMPLNASNNTEKEYYVNIKSYNKFAENYEDEDPDKNIDIIKELKKNKISNIQNFSINDDDIYFLGGSGGDRMSFSKGKYLKTIWHNTDLGKSPRDTYLVKPALVIKLVKDEFLPIDYSPTI